ncbi:MAG: protein translocase subunit SecD [Verrucomicrobiota bacterium]
MNPTLFLMALIFLGLIIWYAASSLDRQRRYLAVALTLLLGAISYTAVIQPAPEVSEDSDSQAPWPAYLNLNPGIDISGGTQFTIQLEEATVEGALDQAVEVIRGRIDQMGTTEPLIQPSGEDRIIVQIPGIEEEDKASYRSQLERIAVLEFVMVHPLNDSLLARIQAGEEEVPFDYRKLPFLQMNDDTGEREEKEILVKRRAAMTGDYVTNSRVTYDQMLLPEVAIKLSSEGRSVFYEAGKRMIEESGEVGRPGTMAVVLDGVVYSAAGFRDNKPIDSDSFVIDGLMENEAIELSYVLENPLQTPVSIVDERGVDPTLGRASIQSGFRAALIGFALVVLFMGVYYRLAGMIAVMALLLNVFFVLGLIAQFDVTVTLPGVAGIILIIGMAVDANVLIYERIREEIDSGNDVIHAIRAGFSKAFSSIMDANVTTLIAAAILFWQGTGAIKGFAVVLCLGILSSLFTALIVTRSGFDWVAASGHLTKLKITHFLSKTNFKFMSLRKACLVASGALILASVGTFFQKGQGVFGVDFVGGDLLTLSFEEKVSDADLREAIGGGDTIIQYQSVTGSDEEYLILRTPFDEAEQIEVKLLESFPSAGFERKSLDKVDAAIGSEFLQKAITAIVLGLVGIFVYVMWRFEASFAIGSIVALIHDVVITIGIFALAGHQLSLVTVGAILTVAGYSINDTIVVFDRIREGIRQHPNMSLPDLVDICVNATLSRTLLTSGTTLIALVALYVFGGLVIHDFAFMLLIGVIIGTYSSIFVASPIVLLFGDRAQKELRETAAATG